MSSLKQKSVGFSSREGGGGSSSSKSAASMGSDGIRGSPSALQMGQGWETGSASKESPDSTSHRCPRGHEKWNKQSIRLSRQPTMKRRLLSRFFTPSKPAILAECGPAVTLPRPHDPPTQHASARNRADDSKLLNRPVSPLAQLQHAATAELDRDDVAILIAVAQCLSPGEDDDIVAARLAVAVAVDETARRVGDSRAHSCRRPPP